MCWSASAPEAQKLLIDFPRISVSPKYNLGSLLGLGLFSQAAAAWVISPPDLIRAALCSERIIWVRGDDHGASSTEVEISARAGTWLPP
jgi:hypothetical protein